MAAADRLADRLASALSDRYAIERELGRGGMATVYLARDLRHPRRVAIKLFRPDWSTPTGVERFVREIDVTARLQHPHILPLLDSGVMDIPPASAEDLGQRLPWYVMPFVEGESLRERLRGERRLPVAEAIRIGREVAMALDYAHRQGVVHRDIKPENILLSNEEPMVADFGIARALRGSEAGASLETGTLTRAGMVVGTVAYMSPEQSAGDRVDGRSDVYSLGSVLFEMLTGDPPYTGATAHEIIARRLTDPLPRLRRRRPDVPTSLEQAVARALAREADHRFPDAASLARALESGATAPAPARARSRVLVPLLLGMLILAAGWFAVTLGLRQLRATRLDAGLLAVAPFDVLGSRHALWREGLVDLLSASLDGAGPLRTAAATTSIRRWDGRADRASARALGRALGAGFVVFGRVVEAGDSVRLSATLLDLIANDIVAGFDLRDEGERMDRLADSLTLRVLEALTRRDGGAARRAGSLGTGSVPALRAYLQGEQYYRRGAWDSAEASYRTAVEGDSGFAAAWYQLARARSWIGEGTDTLFLTWYLRAGALNRGLPPRESLLVAAESLYAAPTATDSALYANQRRRLALLDRAAARYPDDPEVWYALGEARYHEGFLLGVTAGELLDPFRRAVALDSAFAPGYEHLIGLSLLLDGRDSALRYTDGFHRALPPGERADGAAIVRAVLRAGGRPLSMETDAVREASPAALFGAAWTLQYWPDSAATAVRLLEAVQARMPPGQSAEIFGFDPGVMLASFRAARGRLAETRRQAEEASPLVYPWLARLGLVDSGAAALRFRTWLDEERVSQGLGALPLWAAWGDTASIRRYRATVARQRPEELSVRRQALLDAADAYAALARGDSAAALQALLALPDSIFAVRGHPMVTRVELLLARGMGREAVATVQRALDLTGLWPNPMPVYWQYLRARALEQAGLASEARRWYRQVAAMWRDADPDLRRFATEAAGKAR